RINYCGRSRRHGTGECRHEWRRWHERIARQYREQCGGLSAIEEVRDIKPAPAVTCCTADASANICAHNQRESTMETRIQFRIAEDTKRLAQQLAESQGRTLSDACRELAEQMAEQQRKVLSHDAWLTEQVTRAFAKLDSGQAVFVEHNAAQAAMEERKAIIRKRLNQ